MSVCNHCGTNDQKPAVGPCPYCRPPAPLVTPMGDTTDELLVDHLRNQLREVTTKLEAVEKLKRELAETPDGGPSRALILVTLAHTITERDGALATVAAMKANPAAEQLAREITRRRELEIELDAKRGTVMRRGEEIDTLRTRVRDLEGCCSRLQAQIQEAAAIEREACAMAGFRAVETVMVIIDRRLKVADAVAEAIRSRGGA